VRVGAQVACVRVNVSYARVISQHVLMRLPELGVIAGQARARAKLNDDHDSEHAIAEPRVSLYHPANHGMPLARAKQALELCRWSYSKGSLLFAKHAIGMSPSSR
jgi:hypothetical protein